MKEPEQRYILNTGTAEMVIVNRSTVTYKGSSSELALVRYVKSGIETTYPLSRLIPVAGETESEKEMLKSKTRAHLYRVRETDEYGVYLTTNSQGQTVLEMKGGNGQVKAFNKSALEKVVPFTFAIKYATSPTRKYDFLGKAGEVEVNDLLMQDDGTLARVVAVDTKSEHATKEFSGWRVNATRIASNEDENEDLADDD